MKAIMTGLGHVLTTVLVVVVTIALLLKFPTLAIIGGVLLFLVALHTLGAWILFNK